jgi:hypothetical protein
VEICTRLAKSGYVAIAATYRQGWLPLSENQNTVTGTLLQAAYRGIQDVRSLIRYLRKDMAYFYPRACQALQLPGCAISSTEDVMIDEDRVQLQIAPNPASERIFISSKTLVAMEQIQLFDMNGLFLRSYNNIDHHQYEIQRGELPPGMYLLKVRFADGIAVKQVIIQ